MAWFESIKSIKPVSNITSRDDVTTAIYSIYKQAITITRLKRYYINKLKKKFNLVISTTNYTFHKPCNIEPSKWSSYTTLKFSRNDTDYNSIEGFNNILSNSGIRGLATVQSQFSPNICIAGGISSVLTCDDISFLRITYYRIVELNDVFHYVNR